MRYPYYELHSEDCLDDDGNYYTVFKLKCELYFRNMMKSKTEAYDNNYISNKNKTIFLTNFLMK